MRTETTNGIETLIITRLELEQQLLTYAQSEIRSKALLKKELNKPEIEQTPKFINAFAHQEIKARGFKECIEGFLFSFTGKMINIDEQGELIKHE